ncbi:MAG: hypothetical protein Kow0081_2630 [Candidatus Dojkabacteria bacterium]
MVLFPSDIPTKNVKLRNYLPPYTRLSDQNTALSFSSSGSFELNETTFTLENPENPPSATNGIVFTFGNVSAGASWEMIFNVDVEDSFEISDGEILRNLSRLDYENHNSSRFIKANGGAIIISDPKVSLVINNNAKYTKSDLISRYTKVSFPDTSLVNEVRFLHCDDSINCDTSNESSQWKNWQGRTELEKTELDYVINGKVSGIKTICVQLKDQNGVLTQPSCDSIVLDIKSPVGSIVINNGAQSTTDSKVNLSINATDPIIPNVNQSKVFYQISNDGGSWSEWALIPNGSLEIPSFDLGVNTGNAKAFVRFADEAGNISGVYADSIKVSGNSNVNIDDLPVYKIEYLNANSGDLAYSLDSIPTTLNVNQGFPLILDVKNLGSLVWYPAAQLPDYELGEYNPVNISYHWINSDTGQIYEWNGNRGTLTYMTEYNETHKGVFLNVTAPALPGNYLLQIDAVHEGVTWFSQRGNSMPEFAIQVLNPNPEPISEGLPDYGDDASNEDDTADSSNEGQVFGIGDIKSQVSCTTADITNLYFAPSLQSSTITIIPRDIKVRVLNKYQNWLQIKLTDGRIGWINSTLNCESLIEEIPEFMLTQDTYIQSHVCNVRSAELKVYPSWDSKTALTLPLGHSIFVVEIRNDWLKVVTPNGVTGWIFKTFICEGFNPAPTYNVYDNLDYQRPYSEPEINPNGGEYEVGITSDFGSRNGTYHSGVDYGIYCGTELRAIADGRVLQTGTNGITLGNDSTPETPANFIIIQHSDNIYQSWYWHLNDVFVEPNAIVKKGDVIGTVGNTGYVRGNPEMPVDGAGLPADQSDLSAGLESRQGCHLHFEIRATSQNEDGTPNLVDVTGDYLENNRFYPIDPELLLEYGDLTSELTSLIADSVFGIGNSFMPDLGDLSDGIENFSDIVISLTSPTKEQIFQQVIPVYRFWGDRSMSHFYTVDLAERNYVVQMSVPGGAWAGDWKYEGVAFYVFKATNNSCPKGNPVHRFWKLDGGGHFYTINPGAEVPDVRLAIENGSYGNLKYEGVAFCAFKNKDELTIANYISPVYRFYSGLYNSHFYTISEEEKNMVIANTKPGGIWPGVWQHEGPQFFAFPVMEFQNTDMFQLKQDQLELKNSRNYKPSKIFTFCGGIKVDLTDITTKNVSKAGSLYFNPTTKQIYFVPSYQYFDEAYSEIGDSCMKLGLPTTDVYNTSGGRKQNYEFGSIYHSNFSDYTWAVYGEIYNIYKENGESSGTYGFPRSGQYINANSELCQNFDKGVICIKIDKDLDRDGIEDTLENELMIKFAPVIMLDKDESYMPASVEWIKGKSLFGYRNDGCNEPDPIVFYDDSELIGKSFVRNHNILGMCVDDSARGDEVTVIRSDSDRNQSKKHHYFIDFKDEFLGGSAHKGNWAIYSRVYNSDRGSGNYNILYYYFFPNNVPNNLASETLGLSYHEGDWEHVTIELDSVYNPINIYYSAHGDNNPGTGFSWKDPSVQKYNNFGSKLEYTSEGELSENTLQAYTHPGVYIASGTHASYVSSDLPWKELFETFETGQTWQTWKQGNLYNVGELNTYGNALIEFINYAGRWGETQGNLVLVDSPITMSYQLGWKYGQK